MLDENTQAPGFALSDQNGVEVTLESLTDNWVVLWWYPKAGTPG
jgi:peroxiredoxin Q/BCP